MIQNSLSQVVKSRISSSSGRTISVENRSLARTATISSFEYLTTRAAWSAAARAGEHGKATTFKTAIATRPTNLHCRGMRMRCFIDDSFLKMSAFHATIVASENGPDDPRGQHHNAREDSRECKEFSVRRLILFRAAQQTKNKNHGSPPAR